MTRFIATTLLFASLVFGFAACATPRNSDSPQTAYLFTYFTGNGKSGLHLAWSGDGYKWNALGSGASYLKPRVGESKLMRDPCVARGPDGVYHMVWTTSWDGRTIGHASTRDFLTWSEQEAIPVMAGIDGTRNCWAPEIIYDDEAGRFVIYWSSTVEGRFPETAGTSENKYNHRLYYTTTTDFKSFPPAQLLYEPGFSVIDGTLIKFGGLWHLIVKDETVTPPKKHLRIATGAHSTGPFVAPPAAPFTRDWVEGPAAFVGREGEVLVYFDVYREKHYGAMRSRDMKTWEDVTDKISLPSGVRHGTVIEVPAALIDKLRSTDLAMRRPPPRAPLILP
ncbi:hypothetical protein M2103_001761 [Ereboglobus sp. PH5-5]|uniref:glycoside hydrolase family 43 protein n=1 Tax=unclassified Ereboglobus TaxID=2626932 RepID=UPI002405BD47|nr:MULTISPECIES: glycoside hydrolase family 43 protein [unclassified Ereboglobus]MDF9827846.1 hypothetical protein [Ereboglobus sp. PH5-10]MDF9833534.1 hypothetical protein [Ereboglobus sp. PH5-5]